MIYSPALTLAPEGKPRRGRVRPRETWRRTIKEEREGDMEGVSWRQMSELLEEGGLKALFFTRREEKDYDDDDDGDYDDDDDDLYSLLLAKCRRHQRTISEHEEHFL